MLVEYVLPPILMVVEVVTPSDCPIINDQFPPFMVLENPPKIILPVEELLLFSVPPKTNPFELDTIVLVFPPTILELLLADILCDSPPAIEESVELYIVLPDVAVTIFLLPQDMVLPIVDIIVENPVVPTEL